MKELIDLKKESEILLDLVKSYVKRVDELYNQVVLKKTPKLPLPLEVYVDDNYRENFLKTQGTFIMKEKEERNPAEFCMGPGCNKFLGFRGFCSKECHDKAYDGTAQSIINSLEDKGGKKHG